MERYLGSITRLIAKYVGRYYIVFYAAPLAMTAIFSVFLIICIFSKRFRYANKQFCLTINLILFTLWLAVYAVLFSETKSAQFTFVSLLVFALNFALADILRLLSQEKVKLTMRDKRLIGKLSEKYTYDKPRGGTIKRVEYIMPNQYDNNGIEPNFNEIQNIIDKLRREEITPSEEDELDKAEMDMQKFASREPLPFERQAFSDRLLKIVKMMSKYHIA